MTRVSDVMENEEGQIEANSTLNKASGCLCICMNLHVTQIQVYFGLMHLILKYS